MSLPIWIPRSPNESKDQSGVSLAIGAKGSGHKLRARDKYNPLADLPWMGHGLGRQIAHLHHARAGISCTTIYSHSHRLKRELLR